MLKKIGTFKDDSDGSIKTVFEIDKKIIEMTLLFNKIDKDVICVPTHHFCNLGCKMCHLTNNKLNKKMLPITKKDFMDSLYLSLTINNKRRTNKKKLLISFMGVGEPLLNLSLLEEVFKEEDNIKKDLGYEEVGFALATMLPNDNILKLSNIVNKYNTSLKIHFSLHTPINQDRLKLIPSTKIDVLNSLQYLIIYKNEVEKNKQIMDKYKMLHTTDIPIEIHYTLIKDVNDKTKELKEIIKLLKEYPIPIKFIRFNEINDLKTSNQEQVWINMIKKEIPTLKVKTYTPPGKKIGSSCGEFTKHYYHEEIENDQEKEEFENWKKKYEIFE